MTTRYYAAVKADLVKHEKWLAASWSAKAAWITLFLHTISTDGHLNSREQAERLLKRDGSRAPAKDVDELLRLELLDGDMTLHDWQDHQPIFRGPSDDPAAKAERNRMDYERRKLAENGVSESQRDSATFTDKGKERERKEKENTRTKGTGEGLPFSFPGVPLDEGQAH